MKLNEVARPKGNEQLRTALEYYANHPQFYSHSREVLTMLSGWFKNVDPEVTALLDKILAHTKAKDYPEFKF